MPGAVHAVSTDLGPLASSLTRAFADDPVQQWLCAPAASPDAARFDMLSLMVDEYYRLGHVYVVANGAGGALWAPPNRNILEGDRVQHLILRMAPHLGHAMGNRFAELGRAAAFRPHAPHFYLGVLGVDPSHQSEGHGATLVAPVLAACDAAGFPAHLESSNPRNIPFYERLGFVATERYRCGHDGPELTMMTRPPS